MTKETRTKHIRVNREVTWSILENLITLGEYPLADSVLEEHLKVDPLDGKSWLFKSQIQIRQGKADEAQKSLRKGGRILEGSEPQMMKFSQAELSLANGRREEAIAGFKSLSETDGPIAQKARTILDRLEKEPPKGRMLASLSNYPGLIEPKSVSEWKAESKNNSPSGEESKPSMPWTTNANLSLLTGYDANILQIADNIAPLAANTGSMFSTIGLQGVVSKGAIGGVFSANAAAGYTRNFSTIAEGLNNLNLSGGVSWAYSPGEDSSWAFTLASNTATNFMESGSYQLYFLSSSVQPSIAYRINPNLNAEWGFSAGINRFPGVEVTNDRDNRAGSQYGSSLNLRGMWNETSFSTGVSYTQQESGGDNFKTRGFGVNASAGQPLKLWQSSLNPSVGYSKVTYPLSDTARADQLINASLGWEIPIRFGDQALRTTSTLGWSHVSSSDEAATFTKTFFNFQLVYALK